jgi:hypothetical protein
VNVIFSIEKRMGCVNKFLFLENSVLRGLTLEKTVSVCWVRNNYSNRPTEKELNKHFPHLKDRNRVFRNFPIHPETSDNIQKKKNPRLKKQSNFGKSLTPTEKLAVKLR